MSEAAHAASRYQKPAVARRLQDDVVPGASDLLAAFETFRRAGLNDMQLWRILTHCCTQDSPPFQSQASVALGIRPSTMSQQARVLEKHGLLIRTPHPTNGRLKMLVPTRKGRRIVRDAAIVVLGGRP